MGVRNFKTLGHARAEIIHDHIRNAHEVIQQRETFGGFQITGDALLVAVERHEMPPIPCMLFFGSSANKVRVRSP